MLEPAISQASLSDMLIGDQRLRVGTPVLNGWVPVVEIPRGYTSYICNKSARPQWTIHLTKTNKQINRAFNS